MTIDASLDAPWTDLWYASADGLRLHARDYGPRDAAAPPVVCLPGLARSAGDFHELASALATADGGPRRVLALDYRGRGRSDYDPNPRNYDLPVESADILALLAAAGLARAVFVGTSRGGMHVMLLAATHKDVLAGAVLNDIGPVIEMTGLMRIKGYVGQMPTPKTYEEAAALLQGIAGPGFPAFGAADWARLAARSFIERGGALVADHDPALTASLEALAPDKPLPPLWPFFDALKDVPLMLIRGEHSDILSAQTLAAMAERRPDADVLTVAGQGHAPVLWEAEVVGRVVGFVEGIAAEVPRGPEGTIAGVEG